MKIISKRQAMHIYRQHPDARLFAFCKDIINGMAASAITTVVKYKILTVYSLSLLNVVRIVLVLMRRYAA